MGRIEKLKREAINEANIRVMGEAKKQPKKDKDSKYETWCKDNGWENGVGEGCADDALDSKESSIRSWGLGFLMGSKGKSLTEQDDRYLSGPFDREEIEEIISVDGFVNKVEDMRETLNDIMNNIDILDERKRSEIEDDLQTLEHKLDVLWEKVKYLNLPDEDGNRYDDREIYPIDDESRYDDRNYKYGNNPDDDYED